MKSEKKDWESEPDKASFFDLVGEEVQASKGVLGDLAQMSININISGFSPLFGAIP